MSKLADLLADPHGRKNVVIGLLGLIAALSLGILGVTLAASSSKQSPAVSDNEGSLPRNRGVVEGWQRVPDRPGVFGNSDIEQLNYVMYSSGTYIAVGAHDYKPAIWRATDPLVWNRLARVEEGVGDRPSMIWSVDYDGDRYVAVGKQADRAAVWTSDDGKTWRLTPRPARTFGTAKQYSEMLGVTRFRQRWYAGGFFAAGGRRPQVATIWVSGDGVRWTRLTPSTETHRVVGARPSISRMYATNALIVAVGSVNSLVDGSNRCAIWASRDGTHWFAPSIARGTLAPRGKSCVLDSVTNAHGRWLAVGSAGDNPQVWTSKTGLSWSEVAGSLFTNGYGATDVNDVAPTRTGWLAVGNDPGPNLVGDAAVWESSDTKRWLRVHPDTSVFGGPDVQVMASVIAMPSVSVAVGWDGSTGQPRGAVWIQHPLRRP